MGHSALSPLHTQNRRVPGTPTWRMSTDAALYIQSPNKSEEIANMKYCAVCLMSGLGLRSSCLAREECPILRRTVTTLSWQKSHRFGLKHCLDSEKIKICKILALNILPAKSSKHWT